MRYLLFLLYLFLTSFSLNAQTTKVRGTIVDKMTKEPLPLVNVLFCGTTIGVTTDFNGEFTMETRENVSAIHASFVGYETDTIRIKSGQYNEVNIQLNPIVFNLKEIVVHAGENPADILMKKVIKHKKKNNPDKIDKYALQTYTKMEIDVANVKSQFKNKRLQKNFGFIFDYTDTSVVNGKTYLPIMISETYADFYFSRNPSIEKEVVTATRMSGIEEDYSLAQFTGHLHARVNIYENFINLFDINFVSPIADRGGLFYRYYLIDSLQRNNRKTYMLRFHPRGTATPVFDGEFYIDAETYAVESAKLKMIKRQNVNWIRDMIIETDYQFLGDSVWFVKRDKMFADFSIVRRDSSKLLSFFGSRDVSYLNVDFEKPFPKEVEKKSSNVILKNDVLTPDENYWDNVRPYRLSSKEQKIYSMVDSIKNVPMYKSLYDLLNTFMFGYLKVWNIGIGPYYKVYSFNKLEGNRFQLGFQTKSEMSKKIQMEGYLGYSDKQDKFKYSATARYVFRQNLRSVLSVSYKNDVEQLGANASLFSQGNILSSVFARGDNDRLSEVKTIQADFFHEWEDGFSNKIELQMKDLYSTKYVPFITPGGDSISTMRLVDVGLTTRLSWNEIVVRNTFEDIHMGSDYPILSFKVNGGAKKYMHSDYDFLRLNASLEYRCNIPPLGYSNILVSGGKIFGKVPYPLLELHEGNSTYFYNPMAYSCMNFFEFASDLWCGFAYEHHFKGFFLGKFPLIRRLQWREVFTFKGLIGTLTDKNNGSLANTEAILKFPYGMSSVSKPYFEMGVGVENIFRLFRVDALWRLTHLNDAGKPDVQKFTINISMNLEF